jgi:hypothetical protein
MKLENADVEELYQVKMSNRFPAFENTDSNVDINVASKRIREQ